MPRNVSYLATRDDLKSPCFARCENAAKRAPAGIGAICNATTVMFTALVAYAVYGERIGPRRVAGLLAGFVGVVVLASGKTSGGSVAGAALAGTFAAALYGLGANLIRRHISGLPTAAVAAATLESRLSAVGTAPCAPALRWG